MGFHNIDAPGGKRDRIAVAEIQKRDGAAERLAAAKAKRNAKKARRAARHLHPTSDTILFYPWPVGGVGTQDRDGAYANGPNGDGMYQVVVIDQLTDLPKHTPEVYCAAVSAWVGLPLRVRDTFPLKGPDNDLEALDRWRARRFESIILEPADRL